MDNRTLVRAHYFRPIYVAIPLSVFAALLSFLYFGFVQSDGKHLLHQFLWLVAFCGLGMGSVFSIAVMLLVLDRMEGGYAVFITTMIAIVLFGVACNALCFTLDQKFNYFGAINDPQLFLLSGWLLSIVGGIAVGSLLFTDRGGKILSLFGIQNS